MKPLVSIVMGSDSDLPAMNEAVQLLRQYGIGHDVNVLSAHRTPELLRRYVTGAERRGVQVFIAGAGGAAHLPGVVAAYTTQPVIGVPMETKVNGLDSLLSIVQMPRGIPVATVAIGRSGAANAAILAMEILQLKYPEVGQHLKKLRQDLKSKVIAANRKLRRPTKISADR